MIDPVIKDAIREGACEGLANADVSIRVAAFRHLFAELDKAKSAVAEYLDWQETTFMLPSGNFEDPDMMNLARTARNIVHGTEGPESVSRRAKRLAKLERSLKVIADAAEKMTDEPDRLLAQIMYEARSALK